MARHPKVGHGWLQRRPEDLEREGPLRKRQDRSDRMAIFFSAHPSSAAGSMAGSIHHLRLTLVSGLERLTYVLCNFLAIPRNPDRSPQDAQKVKSEDARAERRRPERRRKGWQMPRTSTPQGRGSFHLECHLQGGRGWGLRA